MSELVQALHNQDEVRLQKLSAAIGNGASAGIVSFEGEPIYADRPWSALHEFSYGVLIPAIVQDLPADRQSLDVLYDDMTAEKLDFTEDHFLELIGESFAMHNGRHRDVPIHTKREADMFDRAMEWIDELKGRGVTKDHGRVTELRVAGEKPVALTTRSDGRPTCPVLDAVYQTEKSEQGVGTAILVHSTDFSKQQRDMQEVLSAIHGELPFDALVNIFFRERKGTLRLAAIRQTDRAGRTAELA